MKKIFIFIIFGFVVLVKCFSFPSSEEILKMYPTLKHYKYTNLNFYYSEKIVKLDVDKYSGRILTFKDLDNTYVSWDGVNHYVSLFIKQGYKELFAHPGKNIIITDSGNIYMEYQLASGRAAYSIEKYKIENGKIHLVPQPFYYLGIKQNTDAPFAILYEPNEKASVVANIAKDTEVEVIGVKILNDEKWILIKSGLELTGWVKLFYIEPEQANFHRAFVDILSDSD